MTDTSIPAAPTIAEDLLLVLFDPRYGVIHGEGTLYYPLGGAILSELALAEQVDVEQGRSAHAAQVSAAGSPPEDPLLREVWDQLAQGPVKAHALLTKVGPRLRAPVLERVVERGDIERTRRKVLGIFPSTKLADAGTPRRPELVEQLRAALIDGVEPAPRIAVLAALLSASGQLYTLHRDIPWSGDVHRRGKAFEKGDWGAQGVSRAVTAAAAAVAMTAVVSAAAISGTS